MSEAVRGEGGLLRDVDGVRFMRDEHPMAELGPRDVVARAIARRAAATGADVTLDMRHLDPETVRRRFPTVAELCARHGLDLATDPIPVTPGGPLRGGRRPHRHGRPQHAAGPVRDRRVRRDRRARRQPARLQRPARGGGPRLGRRRRPRGRPLRLARGSAWPPALAPPAEDAGDPGARAALQAAMWRGVGVERDAEGLAAAAEALAAIRPGADAETDNLLLVARLAAEAATIRTESRGAHFRRDHPATRSRVGPAHRLGRRAPVRPHPDRRRAHPLARHGGRMTTTAITPACALPDSATAAGQEELWERAWAARRALGSRAVVLGHHYQRDEVIAFADVTGDSFLLARRGAAATEAELVVFLGVYFMAEAADVLRAPHQTVVLPDLGAGCHLAECADIYTVRDAWSQMTAALPGRRVIPLTYMNSGADLKAFVGEHGGAVCTSGNAEKAFRWALSEGDAVFFFPDEHLGRNTACRLGMAPDAPLVWNPRLAELGGIDGRRPGRRAGHPVEGLLQRPHGLHGPADRRPSGRPTRTCA